MRTLKPFSKAALEGLIALAQVSPARKTKKRIAQSPVKIDDGITILTPDQFARHIDRVVSLGSQGRIAGVLISDPLQPELDINFSIQNTYDANLPRVAYTDISLKGISRCMSGHNRMIVTGYGNFGILGLLELVKPLPQNLAAFSSAQSYSRVVKICGNDIRVLGDKDTTINKVDFDAGVSRVVRSLKTPYDFIDVYASRNTQRDPKPCARLWRPDAPIQAKEFFCSSKSAFLSINSPRRLHASHMQTYWNRFYDCIGIVTDPAYEIGRRRPVIQGSPQSATLAYADMIEFKHFSIDALRYAVSRLSETREYWNIISQHKLVATLRSPLHTDKVNRDIDCALFIEQMRENTLQDIFKKAKRERSINLCAPSIANIAKGENYNNRLVVLNLI